MRPTSPINFKLSTPLITKEITGHPNLQCATLNGKYKHKRFIQNNLLSKFSYYYIQVIWLLLAKSNTH